jgi:hypothetical protein
MMPQGLHKVGSKLGYDATGFAQGGFQKLSRVRMTGVELLQLSTFSERYHKCLDESLSHIVRVTGCEIWVPLMKV